MTIVAVKTVDHLAAVLEVESEELVHLACTSDSLYGRRLIKKKSGGRRVINPPSSRLKGVQRRISDLLLPRIDSPIAFGIAGRTHIDAAHFHLGARFGAKVDIRSCFENVKVGRALPPLRDQGFSGEALDIIVALVFHRGHLPQGSPASPAILNLILQPMDWRVYREAKQSRAVVTRYCDDYEVSGSTRGSVDEALSSVVRGLSDLKLPINRRKFSAPRHGKARLIHGLTVDERVCVPKRSRRSARHLTREALRDKGRRYLRFGCSPADRARFEGEISYAARLHPAFAGRLRAPLSEAPSKGVGS